MFDSACTVDLQRTASQHRRHRGWRSGLENKVKHVESALYLEYVCISVRVQSLKPNHRILDASLVRLRSRSSLDLATALAQPRRRDMSVGRLKGFTRSLRCQGSSGSRLDVLAAEPRRNAFKHG